MIWVSIDPGGSHVGMAFWQDDELVDCDEYTPKTSMMAIDNYEPSLLVIEEFRLYPSMAKTLTGSTMQTSQLIGAMTWWANWNSARVHMQPAAIKDPTKGYMKNHEIQLVKGKGDHAQDAQVHGIHWIVRNSGKPTNGSDLFGGAR